ncbi:phospho-sugar mutase [Paenalkalicoccus suaedae]|uniref:Phosphoglucomutase n=1 Tax=Paenalkalicoccus suaedae TaxID=2592382 RepID=A0A859FEM1_9BACI|nr:phospho-sugar mutase [Paenalkalicoccus suaedae]QKS70676.1 phospho-sugar mutase [Paenalkalicoccus suaedae]
MDYKKHYERWNQKQEIDASIATELKAMSDDEKLLEDSFYKNLEFGTGGMRGEIGPGTNRMNVYTIRKAAQGLAEFIKEAGEDAVKRGAVIAYDNRRMSKEFAIEAAATLGQNGIKTYVFKELRPTPELSFAVRELQTFTGAMITASHNPPEYNGFKVYGEDGAQMIPEDADRLIAHVNAVADELDVHTGDPKDLEASGLLEWVLEDIDRAYFDKLQTVTIDHDLIKKHGDDLSIVFTPLHGTALKPMTEGLSQAGFTNVYVVEEQAQPDTEFSTVASPNPEEPKAFEYAIKLGKQKDADLLIATDPDADRVGLAVKNLSGDYQVLTGNQTGALLLDYLLMKKKELGTLPNNGVMIKTIVTSELGRTIADHYDVATLDVLTGFKFIGEKIREFESTSEYSFLYGYEESFGYLIEAFARDKDAIQPGILAAELAAYYKSQGLTMYEGLQALYKKYGYYFEDLASFTFKGKEGAEKIQRIMNVFRDDVVQGTLPGGVEFVEDYQRSTRTFINKDQEEVITLPKSNVLKLFLSDGSWYCLRPSGTEPKIKCYFGVQAESEALALEKLGEIKQSVLKKLEAI